MNGFSHIMDLQGFRIFYMRTKFVCNLTLLICRTSDMALIASGDLNYTFPDYFKRLHVKTVIIILNIFIKTDEDYV